MTKSVEICAVRVTQRHVIAFLKSVKYKSDFFTSIRMARNSDKKNKQILR